MSYFVFTFELEICNCHNYTSRQIAFFKFWHSVINRFQNSGKLRLVVGTWSVFVCCEYVVFLRRRLVSHVGDIVNTIYDTCVCIKTVYLRSIWLVYEHIQTKPQKLCILSKTVHAQNGWKSQRWALILSVHMHDGLLPTMYIHIVTRPEEHVQYPYSPQR